MINMTTDLFNKFSEQQHIIDYTIKEKHGISDLEWKLVLTDNHYIALKVEMAEFINECHDIWKYWKTKEIDKTKLLDEAADVIHFLHLLINKSKPRSNSDFVSRINGTQSDLYFELSTDNLRRTTLPAILNIFLNSESLNKIYALLLIILDHYGFTLEDIEQAYDRKNAENHARQNRNY